MKSCRGYISSRSFGGEWMPQNVQNIMIREYCKKHDLHYLLSAAEYAIPKCYMVLKDLVQESKNLSGLVLYSAYQLPEDEKCRMELCCEILENKCAIHLCAEDLIITNIKELEKVNIVLSIHAALSNYN